MNKNSARVTLEEIKNPRRFRYDTGFLEDAAAVAVKKVMDILPGYIHDYPTACSTGKRYGKQKNGNDWVEGFWTGMLWLSYELTGNELFRAAGEAQFDDYYTRAHRYIGLAHHDVGFLYSPSIVAQYKLTGAEKAKELGIYAADILAARYSERAGIIQVRDTDIQGTFIVDCCMNLPILFWASRVTGNRSYYLKALSHITQVCNYMVRGDASSYQRYKIDEVTGEAEYGEQGQGYDNESCWARGQAWVIYGLALAYRYTYEEEFLKMCQRVSNYYLNRLPSDHICNWDLIFTGDDDPRDSSAAPVAACGMLELADQMKRRGEEGEIYRAAACSMLKSLAEKYVIRDEKSNGLLDHGVYIKRDRPGKEGKGCGDDECCIWGDYFYLEGLRRLKNEWKNIYW